MSEWKQCRLGDVADYVVDKIDIKSLDTKHYVSTDNMLPNKGGIEHASKLPDGSKTPCFHVNDILVSNIRPYFKKIWKATHLGGASPDVLIFRGDPQKITQDYLYYNLSDDSFFNYSVATSKGTKMPRGDKKAIMDYTIPLPSLPTQRKIASILSALDDKIELNNRMNKNLEEQARAIFDNIELSNFQTKHLSDIADIKYGKNLPQNKLCESGYKVYGGNGVIGNYKDFMYKDPMILISCRGAASGKVTTSTPYSYVTNNSLILELKNYELYEFYKWYFLLNQLHNFATGSAQPQITIENIKSIDIPAPHRNHIAQELSILRSYSNSIYQNELNNSHLTALRDTLLPKLMSGELDVSEVRV